MSAVRQLRPQRIWNGGDRKVLYFIGIPLVHLALVRNTLAISKLLTSNKAVAGWRHLIFPSQTHVDLISKFLFTITDCEKRF